MQLNKIIYVFLILLLIVLWPLCLSSP